MATLLVQSEIIILSWWLLFIATRFPHLIVLPAPNTMTEQKGKGYQGII